METKPSLPHVEFAQKSDPGRDPDKQVNEDSCGYTETRFGHLSVLCDGMGGHQNGREASSLAVAAILEGMETAPLRDDLCPGVRGRDLLREAIVNANARVYALGGTTKHGRPGSTVVAILVHLEGTEVAHVGDSRCYMIHGSQIFQITKDHSMVQKLVDAQLLTPAQAAVHPEANRILRALGSAPDVDVEVRAQSIAHVAGDTFVLCSDGLSDLVEPEEILRVVTSAPASQAVDQLVEIANARGGHDNISVMILRLQERAEGGREPVSATVAQTLMQMPVFPSQPAPGSQNPSSPSASHPVPSGVPPLNVVLPSAPPLARPPPRRLPSPAILLGVLLAVVGVLAGAATIYLVAYPDRNAKQVAPFALSALPPAHARPLAPALPESLDVVPATSAELDAGPAPPLPSLVPSPRPPPRHKHAS